VSGVSIAAETVGANVRRLRAARGLSLAELGRRAGLAKGTLTQLEGGRANPTIDTLHTLSRALGATLGELVADPPDDAPAVVRADEGPRMHGWDMDARLVRRTRLAGAILELYHLELEPGSVQHSPAHGAGVLEHLFVLDGVVHAGPEEQVAELGAGDFVSFGADRPHRYAAPDGAARALLLMVFPAVQPTRGGDEPRLAPPAAAEAAAADAG